MNEQYLAFVDYIGKTDDGKHIYRIDFTEDSEIVWGDYFHITPAIIVPDIQPDNNCLSKQAKFNSPIMLELATKSPCFSMQDCIDGLISLCFSPLTEDALYTNDELFKLNFGITFDEVSDILKSTGLEMYDLTDVVKGDESEIDSLIEQLGGEDDNDPEDF